MRHRPVKKRTTEIIWLSATVVLFITKQKEHLAPVMFLALITAGKNDSAYCSPDDEGFQFPALLVNDTSCVPVLPTALEFFSFPFHTSLVCLQRVLTASQLSFY